MKDYYIISADFTLLTSDIGIGMNTENCQQYSPSGGSNP